MNRNFLTSLKELFVTFLVTSLLVFSLCLCVELELLFRCEENVNKEELNMKNLVEFCTIEQLEKYLKKDPTNYFVKIKLAQIYESLKEYDDAAMYYKDALKTSGNSNFSIYSYAIFCAKRAYYNESVTLAEQLAETDKNALIYKTKIYEQLALSFFENKQYSASNMAYQIAFKYAKNLKDRSYYKKIRDAYSKSYIDLADDNIKNDKILEAISDLKNSLAIKYTDIAMYKLGLVNLNIDKFSAEKYISKVFKNNPYMVNPYIYNKLLSELIEESKISSGLNSSDFYTVKLNMFKNTLSKIYLYKDDISVENSYIGFKKGFFDKKKRYFLVFDVENNTKFKINSLFFQMEIFVENKKYTIEKKLFSSAHSLDFYDKATYNKVFLPKEFKLNDLKSENNIIIKYYAKKEEKAPWTLIKIDSLNI